MVTVQILWFGKVVGASPTYDLDRGIGSGFFNVVGAVGSQFRVFHENYENGFNYFSSTWGRAVDRRPL